MEASINEKIQLPLNNLYKLNGLVARGPQVAKRCTSGNAWIWRTVPLSRDT